ncbi:uncharacterized protein LOC113791907 isoform X1 [Dermatophagoides pteronyssinus]|uniref:uncharacterized protein LOC113791907 isoform X1 n=1 Tax=Dermatophagoides pteronyssinus TaxID=6956 RepID=UPI003F67715B
MMKNLSFKNIRTKLESSKSLDMVDDQKLYSTNSSNDNNNNNNSSRLPRSLTSSCKRLSSSMKICGEPFFDVTNDPKTMMALHDNHQQNQNNKTIETNISRSSTASLSLISNMNDAILNDISDNDDDDYNDSILDLRGRLLTAIDESSLSPLPSFNSIITTDHNNQSNNNNNSSMNIGVENNDDNIVIMMTDEKSVEPDANMIFEQSSLENIQQLQPESEIMDEESALSLNSIELIQETNSDSLNCVEEKIDATKIEPKNVAKSLNKRTANDDKCTFKSNKSTKSSVTNRINNTANKHPISASTKSTTSTTKTLLNASTALMKAQVNQNRLISKKSGIATTRNIDYLNRKNLSSNNSSKPCSTNVSRCTTPALSEADSVCSLSTFTTNSTKSKRSTKMITNSAQNVNKRPYSSSTKDIHSTNSKNYYSHQKNGNDSNVSGLKKSTTYTRLAQTSSSSSTKSAVVATRKENVNPINNDMAVTGTGKNSHSFAKPTTSYLRKAANNAPRQSPSGLSNINNANSVVTKTTNKPIGSVSGGGSGPSSTFTAKRSPTITLLNSLALSNKSTSNSANSSRRSSIASPTKPPVNLNSSKKDILQQLQYYENLSYERLQLIEKKKLELKQLSSKTNGFLTLFSFLLVEYRPFDTPKLRAELLTANQKCSNLNRDYELAKEISHQKQAEINLLMTNVGELTNVIEEHKEKIASIENQYNELKQEAESFDDERKRLENELHEAQSECANGKGIITDLEKRLDKAEGLLRTDRKYRELKEKVSNYEKEVDSLNVVVDMKTQRIRYLESEKMRTELELVDYEQLKESYQQLQRENEALTEALGMKARKNAEQSRELDILRTELKRETNERKRLAARYDTLEFQLNESRDMLSNISNMNNILNEESIKNAQSDEAGFFTPGQTTNSNFVESSRKSRPGSNSNAFRQLFSTPMMSDSQFKSRYHFQHQDPASDTSHRLPEVVLSSMNSSNCRSFHNKRNTTTTETNTATNVNVINGHQSSSSSPQSSFHPPTKLNTQTHHTDHHHHQHNHHHQDIDPISTDSSLASSNSEERESRFFE